MSRNKSIPITGACSCLGAGMPRGFDEAHGTFGLPRYMSRDDATG